MTIDFQFKTAVFDIDGTLIDRNEVLFDGVLESLSMLKEKGINLLLATGRNSQSIRDLKLTKDFFELFNQPLICNDGNTLYNYNNGELRIINSIPKSLVRLIIEEYSVKRSFVIESNGKIFSSSKEALLKYKLVYRTPRDLITIISSDQMKNLSGVTEIHIFGNHDLIRLDEIKMKYPLLLGYNINHFGGVKLYPRDSCKANGISEALLPLGVNLKEVAAFGDAENDETMLIKCGMGIAVKGCKEMLLDKADMQLDKDLGVYLQEWVQSLRSIHK